MARWLRNHVGKDCSTRGRIFWSDHTALRKSFYCFGSQDTWSNISWLSSDRTLASKCAQLPSNKQVGLADFGIGFATAFTNPQPLAFYLAIVPQVAATTELGWLSLVVVIGFGLVTLFYAALARPVSELLKRKGPKVLNRSIAVLLLGVAIWILLR